MAWISSLILWSTFDNGSSNNKLGFESDDLAKDVLWVSPYLIWCGNLSTTCSKWRNFLTSSILKSFSSLSKLLDRLLGHTLKWIYDSNIFCGIKANFSKLSESSCIPS